MPLPTSLHLWAESHLSWEGSHFSLCLWVRASRCDLVPLLRVAFPKLVINNKAQSFKDTLMRIGAPWKTAKASERGRGKGFACQVPCSALLQGEVAVARELGSRLFHTEGFRNPLPSLPWLTAARCISLSLKQEPLPGRGGAAFIWPCMRPGPGWAISWGVCVCTHSSRR